LGRSDEEEQRVRERERERERESKHFFFFGLGFCLPEVRRCYFIFSDLKGEGSRVYSELWSPNAGKTRKKENDGKEEKGCYRTSSPSSEKSLFLLLCLALSFSLFLLLLLSLSSLSLSLPLSLIRFDLVNDDDYRLCFWEQAGAGDTLASFSFLFLPLSFDVTVQLWRVEW
jgi:hypothetical protein